MPPYNWPTNPIALVASFEARHKNPDAGALLAWAVWAVDCLYYLDDIDHAYDGSRIVPGNHRFDVVDVAHARWATGTCITGLDLCAAAFGRVFCGHKGQRELALADFAKPTKRTDVERAKRMKRRRAQLTPLAQRWIDKVFADRRWKEIKSARDWLTHSRMTRHFNVATGSRTNPRLQLGLPTTQVDARHLILAARDMATQHISALLAILPQL
jgi:hypothetical protein